MNPSPVSFLVPGDSVEYDELAGLNSYQSTGRQGKLLRISGCIDLDNKMSMGCVGAILTYLQRKRGSEYLQDDPDAQGAYQVTNMEMFSLRDTMSVTSPEYVENIINWIGSSTQILYFHSKSSSLSPILMRSTKGLVQQALKSRYRFMVFSNISLAHLKDGLDFGGTFFDPVST